MFLTGHFTILIFFPGHLRREHFRNDAFRLPLLASASERVKRDVTLLSLRSNDENERHKQEIPNIGTIPSRRLFYNHTEVWEHHHVVFFPEWDRGRERMSLCWSFQHPSRSFKQLRGYDVTNGVVHLHRYLCNFVIAEGKISSPASCTCLCSVPRRHIIVPIVP